MDGRNGQQDAVSGGGRAMEVAPKVARVREMLRAKSYSGLLLTTQGNVSWITGGVQDAVIRGEDPGLVWVLVTHDMCYVITQNVEAPRLAAEEALSELPDFALHVYDWWKPAGAAEIVLKLVDPDRLISDGWGLGEKRPDWVRPLRFELTPREQQRLLGLGADCCTVLEEVLSGWRPGSLESDIAADIASGLEHRGVFPSVLMVGADQRRRRFRHPITSSARSKRDILAVVVGVRQGLNVALSRTVVAGQPPLDLARDHEIACSVEAALVRATSPGRSWQTALLDGLKAYEFAGRPDEWHYQYQGGPIGYQSREFDVVPGTTEATWTIGTGQAFAWNPTVGGAKSEDTFLTSGKGPVPVTNSASWPTLTVTHESGDIERPAILVV